MEKKIRVNTKINSDTVLQVNMKQDFEMMEVLSLNMSQENAYRIHSSNYGVIVGRVLANDAFGIPNAKVSVFIARSADEDEEISNIYPYTTTTSKDSDERRYNLLPDEGEDSCYTVVGTFPNKTYMLDNDIYLEVYDKYWKYTTVTNEAGDYMLFGVPVGNQQIHVDIDLSDIGILSQKPRDFEYKGYNVTQFDNASQFKSSTNLDNLAQIFSQGRSVYVYPFWGDKDNGIVAITRADVQIQYKFEPTCVFMGSIISDNSTNAIEHRCSPTVANGNNRQMVAGEGTIEMIRKTTDGLTEEIQIQGNRLIDADGVFCYQIPMNLDYVGTDEYGNIVPTNNPNKGIPTRTRVRFRFSKHETGDEGFSRHTAKYLVPNNPEMLTGQEYVIPTVENGQDLERYFAFGSSTPDNCFRDMYWNKVYSVKNYVPRIQTAKRNTTKNYSGIKSSNLTTNQNPAPFSNLRFELHFTYIAVCELISIMMIVISVVNTILSVLLDYIFTIKILGVKLLDFTKYIPFGCISFGAGLAGEGNTAYYPGCDCGNSRHRGCDKASCPEGMDRNCEKKSNNSEMLDKIQQNLAVEYEIAKTDFYNDWINGCLYMPLWRWRKRKKRSFLFGLFHSSAKNEFCSCSRYYKRLTLTSACKLSYASLRGQDTPTKNTLRPQQNVSVGRIHKSGDYINLGGGIIKNVQNKDGLDIYYYTPGVPRNNVKNVEKITSPLQYVRLYATDIILLGSLSENDLHGVPQLFKSLPSTTSNVPAIATVSEYITDEDSKASNNDRPTEDTGNYIVTGMDWGNKAHKDDEVKYRKGLFMDLSCTSISTAPKTCINAERMSELGVTNDMLFRTQYGASGKEWGEFYPDGMITKLELDDYEARAMFATLNHVGFVPRAENYVTDNKTGYNFNRFKFLYPLNFDGKMQSSIDRYVNRNTFQQGEYDNIDKAYTEFRYGNEKPSNWHFYNRSDNGISFPLYNNSFYFYFGLKSGSTAIDKFNKLFYSECYQNSKKPFNISYKFKTLGSCPKEPEDFAYMILDVDGIATPYTYSVYNAYGELIGDIMEDNVDRYIGIGCEVKDDGTPIIGSDSSIKQGFYADKLIKNGTYKIKVTDANGKSLTKTINLEDNNISLIYNKEDLGAKYVFPYSNASDEETRNREIAVINETSKDYIVDNQFYGNITVSGVTIDGDTYIIDGEDAVKRLATIPQVAKELFGDVIDDRTVFYELSVTNYITQEKKKHAKVIMYISPLNGRKYANLSYSDISGNKEDNLVELVRGDYEITVVDKNGDNKTFIVNSFREAIFNVFYPDSYNIGIYQDCDSQYVSNVEDDEHVAREKENLSIKINNGEPFDILMNRVPLKMLMGKHEIVNKTTPYEKLGSKFYNSKGDISKDGNFIDNSKSSLNGWLFSYDPSSYLFPQNDIEWEEYINITENKTLNTLNKVAFKLFNIFNVLDVQYFNDESNKILNIESRGGKHPIVIRSLSPRYEDIDVSNKDARVTEYTFGSIYSIPLSNNLPNIVGDNYDKAEKEDKPFNGQLNPFIGGGDKQGIYFAGFTANAAMKGNTKNRNAQVDIRKKFQSVPNGSYSFNGTKRDSPTLYPGSNYLIQTDRLTDIRNPNIAWRAVYGENTDTIPYFRFMTIDTRIDYKLTVLCPSSSQSDAIIDKSNDWVQGCMVGDITNGVLVNYDPTTHSIIDETGDLEYSYDTDGNVRWNGATTKSRRRFYNLTINNVDYTNEVDYTYGNHETFPSKYPFNQKIGLYGITGSSVNLSVTSCAYDKEPTVKEMEDGTLKLDGKVKAGETVGFNIKYSNILTTNIGLDDDNDFTFEFALQDGGGEATFKREHISFGYSTPPYDDDNLICPGPPTFYFYENSKKIDESGFSKFKGTGAGLPYFMGHYKYVNGISDAFYSGTKSKLKKLLKNKIEENFKYLLPLVYEKSKIRYNGENNTLYKLGDNNKSPLTTFDSEIKNAEFYTETEVGGKKCFIVAPLEYFASLTDHIKRNVSVLLFSDPLDGSSFNVTFEKPGEKGMKILINPRDNATLTFPEGISFEIRYHEGTKTINDMGVEVTDSIFSGIFTTDKYTYENNNGQRLITLDVGEIGDKIVTDKPFYIYITSPCGFVYKVVTNKIK